MNLEIIIPIISGIVLLAIPSLFKGGISSYFGVTELKLGFASLKEEVDKLQSQQDNRDSEIQNLNTKVVVLESRVSDMNILLKEISADIKVMMRGGTYDRQDRQDG